MEMNEKLKKKPRISSGGQKPSKNQAIVFLLRTYSYIRLQTFREKLKADVGR